MLEDTLLYTWGFIMGMLALASAQRYAPPLTEALRRALRRSEPRPKTTLRYGRITSKQELPPLVFPDDYYDPQPPQSPPPSEAGAGKNGG